MNRNNGPFAVIDVGSHFTRLEIAQVLEGSEYEQLEFLSHSVPLGVDVFTSGKISVGNTTLVGLVLKDFVKVMREYGVKRYKAIATAAVREAENRELFIDRVKQLSGVELAELESSRETRLIALAVKDIMGGAFGFKRQPALMCAIGTGSTQFGYFMDGVMLKSEEARIGSLRLMEELERPVSGKTIRGAVKPFVDTMAITLSSQLPFFPDDPTLLIGVGASARALATALAPGRKSNAKTRGLASLTRSTFERIAKNVTDTSPERLVEKYDLSDTLARSLETTCLILDRLFELTRADRLIVPLFSTRDALIRDYIREISGQEDDPFTEDMESCAKALGRRFNYDQPHSELVTKIASLIFDKTTRLHGVNSRGRLLLRLAAICHDIGLYISSRRHHKHSYYLLNNSQLPGLTQREQNLVAAVARYHRRAMPKESHPEYGQLATADKALVCKLAAILRVADSLAFAEKWTIKDIAIEADERQLMVWVEGPLDLALENWSARRKANLFTEVFGLKIRIAGGQ